jgi:hypothetical protein
MDEHLIDEVESSFPTDSIVTTTTYQKLPFGLVMWTLKVHSPSDWTRTAQWDRGITFGYERAFKAAREADRAYLRTVRQQESDLIWGVVDDDDPEEWR